jgi:putative Ca2+/H+ antiporter (TMEM165/GDT1 family)
MIFIAELGDKTQLATLAFAAKNNSRLAVFAGSACALILTSLLAVLSGSFINRVLPVNYIRMGSGVMFVILGLWMLLLSGTK